MRISKYQKLLLEAVSAWRAGLVTQRPLPSRAALEEPVISLLRGKREMRQFPSSRAQVF